MPKVTNAERRTEVEFTWDEVRAALIREAGPVAHAAGLGLLAGWTRSTFVNGLDEEGSVSVLIVDKQPVPES